MKKLLIGTFTILAVHFSNAQEDRVISVADSLFANNKYTEAYLQYEELFQDGMFTPAMLLKMAFIQDGSDNYAEALYYLDFYFQKTADRSVIGKIEEIAEEQTLEGYKYNDWNYFVAVYKKYKLQIVLLFLSLILLCSTYIYYTYKKQRTSKIAYAFQLLLVVFMFFLINFDTPQNGIILESHTLLREAPSAAADIKGTTGKGHKVRVLQVGPIWTHIRLADLEAFIKTSRVRPI